MSAPSAALTQQQDRDRYDHHWGRFPAQHLPLPNGPGLPIGRGQLRQRMAELMPRWRIEMKRGKSTDELGIVDAPTKTDALRQAIKSFDIPAVLQNLLVVSRVEGSRTKRNEEEIDH
jgi:hypothetical protein